LADELSAEVRVLCFDELFVSDIGDAILIGGLFQKLFDNGLILIATSNQPPSQLYADGFNRERFLPAIAAIERHMQVLSLAGGQFRRRFDHGLILLPTSNPPPSQLYADGFNRERFLPAIAAIERHMQVLSLDGGQDHRLHPGAPCQRYWVREPQQPSAFPEL